MYCPACSSHAAEKQKFCRACGMSLEGLAERVALHQSALPPVRSEFTSLLIAAGKWLALGGLGLMLLTFLLALLSVAFGVFSKDAIEAYTMKSLAISLTLMVLGGGTLSLPAFLQRERKSALLPQPSPSAQSGTGARLEELPRQPGGSSVTEATTRNLTPALAEKAKQRE